MGSIPRVGERIPMIDGERIPMIEQNIPRKHPSKLIDVDESENEVDPKRLVKGVQEAMS